MQLQRPCLLLIYLAFVACGSPTSKNEFVLKGIEKERAKEELQVYKEKLTLGTKKEILYLTNYLEQIEGELKRIEKKYDALRKSQNSLVQNKNTALLIENRAQIQSFQHQIELIKNEITESQKTIQPLALQKEPENLVLQLFTAANNNDFTILRHLGDPFGENDDEISQICHLTMFPKATQNQFIQQFKNGNILESPIIVNNRAQIKVRIDAELLNLETIHLINRKGYWYFKNI